MRRGLGNDVKRRMFVYLEKSLCDGLEMGMLRGDMARETWGTVGMYVWKGRLWG